MNCAVSRRGRSAAWAVNCTGVYNCLTAAVSHSHERFINTGPHWALFGPEEAVSLELLGGGGGGSLGGGSLGSGVIDENHPLSPGAARPLPCTGSPSAGQPRVLCASARE